MRRRETVVLEDSLANFNPRIYERCDSNIVSLRYSRFVLIHAPVRDATRIWNCYPLFCANFNPRTHKRVRPKEEIIFSEMSSTILIHTPVRGATYFYVIHDILTSYFNPRTHEGCDVRAERTSLHILIHASTEDATAIRKQWF